MASIRRVDHIAFAVKDLEAAKARFQALYGACFIGQKVVAEAQYEVAYFMLGESMITLIESTSPEGFVAKFVAERGEGIHHLGIEVDDLTSFIGEVEAQGVRVANRVEGEVRRECLIGPRNGFGTVLQVIEWLGPCCQATPEERVRLYGGG